MEGPMGLAMAFEARQDQRRTRVRRKDHGAEAGWTKGGVAMAGMVLQHSWLLLVAVRRAVHGIAALHRPHLASTWPGSRRHRWQRATTIHRQQNWLGKKRIRNQGRRVPKTEVKGAPAAQRKNAN